MTTYEVCRDDLAYNLQTLKKMAGDTPIWAVIKGNGYGIGALPLAKAAAEVGITRFCVTQVQEAELLRANGFSDAQILMLRQCKIRRKSTVCWIVGRFLPSAPRKVPHC